MRGRERSSAGRRRVLPGGPTCHASQRPRGAARWPLGHRGDDGVGEAVHGQREDGRIAAQRRQPAVARGLRAGRGGDRRRRGSSRCAAGSTAAGREGSGGTGEPLVVQSATPVRRSRTPPCDASDPLRAQREGSLRSGPGPLVHVHLVTEEREDALGEPPQGVAVVAAMHERAAGELEAARPSGPPA